MFKRAALVVFLGLLAAAAAEQWFEARDLRHVEAAGTFARLGASRVRYQLLGKELAAAPVVFVNGIGGSLEQWDEVQREVAGFAPALAWDRGGAGFSRSAAHDGIGQAEELRALLDALHLARPAVLVGYSSGALVARIFAARYPERVAGLLLLEPRVPQIELRLGWPKATRRFLRPMVRDTLSCFFGVRRLRDAFGDGPRTPLEQRARAVHERFWHWWALDRETFLVADTDRQAMAAGMSERIPLIVLTSESTGEDSWTEAYQALLRGIASSSVRGEVRILPRSAGHEHLLQSPVTRRALVGAIRELSTR